MRTGVLRSGTDVGGGSARTKAGLRPAPGGTPVTSDARALAPVRTHALASYDRLQKPKGDDDDNVA